MDYILLSILIICIIIAIAFLLKKRKSNKLKQQKKDSQDIHSYQKEEKKPSPEIPASLPSNSVESEQAEYKKEIEELQKQPQTPETLFKKARALIGLDRIEEAKRILLSLEPREDFRKDEVVLTLGIVYYNQRQLQEARFWFNRAKQYQQTREKAVSFLTDIEKFLPMEITDSEKLLDVVPIKTDVHFSDVIGLSKPKKYLKDNVINAIKNPEKFDKIGRKRNSGVLLYGPPGTGKTLLAKAIACECDAYFISPTSSEITSAYPGTAGKNIHNLFLQARMRAPAVIFIDEIDGLGALKEGQENASSSIMRQIVSQMQIELDGITSNTEGIFFIGGTNRPWLMDSALLRSGRMGDLLYVPLPGYFDRIKMLKFYLSKREDKEVKINVNVERIARATVLYSASDISEIVNKALAYTQERDDKRLITLDFLRAIAEFKPHAPTWFASVGMELSTKQPDELLRYEELVKDIRKNVLSPYVRAWNNLMKFSAKVI